MIDSEDIWIATIVILGIWLIGIFTFLLITQVDKDNEDVDNQCKELGYNEFIRDGWTGDFCVGDESSIQVILNKGKIIPIEK